MSLLRRREVVLGLGVWVVSVGLTMASQPTPLPGLAGSPDPCALSERWLTVSVDAFLSPGAWSVIVCRNGSYHTIGQAPARGAQSLARTLKVDLSTDLSALPQELSYYAYGQQTPDSWTLLLTIHGTSGERRYLVGDLLERTSCGENCATVLRIAERLQRLLPAEFQRQALPTRPPQMSK